MFLWNPKYYTFTKMHELSIKFETERKIDVTESTSDIKIYQGFMSEPGKNESWIFADYLKLCW